MTRYGLALMLFAGRLRISARVDFWPNLVRRIVEFAKADINLMPSQLLQGLHVFLFHSGVSPEVLTNPDYINFFKTMVSIQPDTTESATQTMDQSDENSKIKKRVFFNLANDEDETETLSEEEEHEGEENTPFL